MIDTTDAPRSTAYSTVRTVHATDSSGGNVRRAEEDEDAEIDAVVRQKARRPIESREIEALVELRSATG